MRLLTLAIISLMAVGAATALDLETVILATDTDTPDLYAASAAGTNEGTPVLITDDGELTQDIKSELLYLGTSEVIIIGGPLAVSTDIEDELKNLGYDVTRLAGVSSTGTALEVAGYFFPDDVDCAVLVEEGEWEDQMDGSNLASEEGCPMIPVPSDDVPASVLEFLQNRNITRVRYIARTIRNEIRERLMSFNLTEIIGTREQVRNWIRSRIMNHTIEMTGNKPELIVIAAPLWNNSLSFGARPMQYSMVWKISSADGIQELVDYINANDIETVRIQGVPSLVTEIYNELDSLGVSVSRVSKENTWSTVKDIVNSIKGTWNQRVQSAAQRRLIISYRIRERIRNRINSTEAEMNTLEAEIETMAIEGTNVTSLNSTLQQAKARLTTAKSTVDTDWNRARQLLAKTVKDVWVKAWKNNIRGRLLNIVERSQDETQGITGARDRLTELEAELREALVSLNQNCDAPLVVSRLVDSARELKNTAVTEIQAGNYGRAAVAVGSAQELIRMANSLKVMCQNRGTISSSMQNAVQVSTALANRTLISVGAMGN